jgi:hypothetical protein
MFEEWRILANAARLRDWVQCLVISYFQYACTVLADIATEKLGLYAKLGNDLNSNILFYLAEIRNFSKEFRSGLILNIFQPRMFKHNLFYVWAL